MVIPIGPQGFYQTLWKFVKEGGELVAYNMGNVVFVPFTGEAGVCQGLHQSPKYLSIPIFSQDNHPCQEITTHSDNCGQVEAKAKTQVRTQEWMPL